MEVFQKEKPYINWALTDIPGLTFSPSLLCDQGYKSLQNQWIENCLLRGVETLSKMFFTDTFQAKFLYSCIDTA